MAKSSQINGDVTTEKYKGPNEAVAAAGEGGISHWALGLLGLVVGGVFGAIFHNGNLIKSLNVNRWVELSKGAARDWATSGNFLKRWSAPPLKWLVGVPRTTETAIVTNLETHLGSAAGKVKDELSVMMKRAVKAEDGAIHEMSDLVHKIPGFGKISESRRDAAIAAGGTLGLIGFLIAPIAFMFHGAKNASEGRNQFKRMRQEVLDTRAQYDVLSQRYAETRVELDQLKTSNGRGPRISADDTPKVEQGVQPAVPEADKAAEPRVRDQKEPPAQAAKQENAWTPDGKVEHAPIKPPNMPWGDKVGSKAKTDNWQENVRANQAAGTEPVRT